MQSGVDLGLLAQSHTLKPFINCITHLKLNASNLHNKVVEITKTTHVITCQNNS